MSDTTRLYGVRFDTGEVLVDLTRFGLYAARINLQLYLSLNPQVGAEQVAILERDSDGHQYHFAAMPADELDSIEMELAADWLAQMDTLTVQDVLAP